MRKLLFLLPVLLWGLSALIPKIELTGYAFAAQQIDTLYIQNDNADVSAEYNLSTLVTTWKAFVGGTVPNRYLTAGLATHSYDTNFHFPWDTDAKSAELDSVVLYFYNLEQKTGNHNVRIVAHKIKSAPATTDSTTFKTGYTDSTTAVVLDSRTAYAAVDSTWYRHPDIKALIQENMADVGMAKADTLSLYVRNNNSGTGVTWRYLNYGNNTHQFDTRLLVYWTPQATEGKGLQRQDISGGQKW